MATPVTELARVRRALAKFMAAALSKGFSLKEESLTDYLLSQLPDRYDVKTFTRLQEGRTFGADWLWWWTDGHDWFGSLVQAKRRYPGRDPYDFGYTPRKSAANPSPTSQLSMFLSAATQLGVPPWYVLYNGVGLPGATDLHCCRHTKEGLDARLTTAILPALVAQADPELCSVRLDLQLPLECVACEKHATRVDPWWSDRSVEDLQEFLQTARSGPHSVAAGMLLQVGIGLRSVEGMRASSRLNYPDQTVQLSGYGQAPDDEALVWHVLRGVRDEPPEYLADGVLDDSLLPVDVAGVVVVQMPLVGEQTR